MKKSKRLYKNRNVRYTETETGFEYYYYDTKIVEKSVEDGFGILKIKTNGYFTASTKRHINEICRSYGFRFRLYTKDYTPRFWYEGNDYEWDIPLKNTLVLNLGPEEIEK